jgi:uncharacterized protein YcaQ
VGTAADRADYYRMSPFEPVVCYRRRTARLFGFDHRLEIFVSGPKRRWGYYVPAPGPLAAACARDLAHSVLSFSRHSQAAASARQDLFPPSDLGS